MYGSTLDSFSLMARKCCRFSGDHLRMMLNKWPNGARNILDRRRCAEFRSYVLKYKVHSVGYVHWRTISRQQSRKRMNWLIRGWCWWLKTLFVTHCIDHLRKQSTLYLCRPLLLGWSSYSHCDTVDRLKLLTSSKCRMTKYRIMELAVNRLIIDGFCIQSTRCALPLSRWLLLSNANKFILRDTNTTNHNKRMNYEGRKTLEQLKYKPKIPNWRQTDN